jgi:hypothetical protein
LVRCRVECARYSGRKRFTASAIARRVGDIAVNQALKDVESPLL